MTVKSNVSGAIYKVLLQINPSGKLENYITTTVISHLSHRGERLFKCLG